MHVPCISRSNKTAAVAALLLTVVAVAAIAAEGPYGPIPLGPSASLFGPANRARPLTLENASWIYRTAKPQLSRFELHDVITVVVDEKSSVTSEGEIDQKKKAHRDLILKAWVLLKGLTLIPDPLSAGEPHIRAEADSKTRAEATLEARDSLKSYIGCTILEIRPNGLLVIEGHDTITYNNEVWEMSLSGLIRPQDVQQDNTVLSQNIVYKRISKRTSGQVRDGYDRGWLAEFLDHIRPL